MNLGLKQLSIADLQHDLKSWGWAFEMEEITEKKYNNITGKILAELERRGVTQEKPLNDKAA